MILAISILMLESMQIPLYLETAFEADKDEHKNKTCLIGQKNASNFLSFL